MKWHSTSKSALFEALGTSAEGLPPHEAAQRLLLHGPNELMEQKRRSGVQMFLLQFRDIMIFILFIAAIIATLAGDFKDAIIILVIIVLNAIAGFVQEYRAEKAMDALKSMSVSRARVRRGKNIFDITAADIVTGDAVLLEAGDRVPADLRIIEQHRLRIDESSLTGESTAVDKTSHELADHDTPLADRRNMAYKNTIVTYGRGVGIAVATGMKTEVGTIAQMLQDAQSRTPLQQRLTVFSKNLSFAVLGICIVIYGAGILRGEDPLKTLLVAISVAVAAVPEALPSVITIALALGARKMVRKQVLIRKLPAVESLGSVTFICTDKTGTLTQNQMTVVQTWASPEKPAHFTFVTGAQDLLLLAMHLNHDAVVKEDGSTSGDATEAALARHAKQHLNMDAVRENLQQRVFELPFDSDRKMMTTVHALNHGHLVITKGALEAVLELCPEADAALISQQAGDMAAQGQRVLAYSCKIIKGEWEELSLESEQTFCGLAGMIDPPREEALKAVEECTTAGIVPVMITGDHPGTARAISTQLGILKNENDKVITGARLEKLSEAELAQQVIQIKVYARVTAAQKLRIVKALQSARQFVAMTGDGVNDSPALKQSNIGIAMGITGTDISKEAAHMILLDDNFASIVKAVKEGRRIFDNIRKFIRYILTGNSAEIWTIFLAPLIGLPIPLLPVHILWINLVTDGLPGITLASEPAEKNIMQRPPRLPGESIFANGLGYHVLWVGLLMAGLCLGVQSWALYTGDSHWQTMVFTMLCFCQMMHVIGVRSERNSILRLGFFSNLPLAGAVLLTVGLQLAIIYLPPMQAVFSTQALTAGELFSCAALSALVLVAVEIEKTVRRRQSGASLSGGVKDHSAC